MSPTSEIRVNHFNPALKQPVLNDLDPTLAFFCHNILGNWANSTTIVAVLREAGITNFHLLNQLTEFDVGKLYFMPIGSSSPRPLAVGLRVTLQSFIKWSKHLIVKNGRYLTDEQWRSINPLKFKMFIAKKCGRQLESTAVTPAQHHSKEIEPIDNFTRSNKQATSLEMSPKENRSSSNWIRSTKTQAHATDLEAIVNPAVVIDSVQRPVTKSLTIAAETEHPNGASTEEKSPKLPSRVVVDYRPPHLADEDPATVFDTSVVTLPHTSPANAREAAPPVVKIDTTTIPDDDPNIMADSAITTSTPVLHNWLKNQAQLVTKERCATENQPKSRDIFSVRFFKGKNDHLDPTVYPSHQKSSCFEEFIFSTLTGMDPTKTSTVKGCYCFMNQLCLSELDPSPKYFFQDILEIRKIPHTLISTAVRKTELINVGILIILLPNNEFDEPPQTRTSLMSFQHRLDPTAGETTPLPNTLLAEGETSKTAMLTLTPPPIIFLAEGKHAETNTFTTVSLSQAKGETNEITSVAKSTTCDRLFFDQIRNYCSYLYSTVNMHTKSKYGELSIKVATNKLADDDPLHPTATIMKLRQFLLIATMVIILMIIYQHQHPTNGEPTNHSTHGATGIIVATTFALERHGSKTIAIHSDDKCPENAQSFDFAIIDDAMINFESTLEPPLIAVMINKLSDGDPKISVNIGVPLPFTHAIICDLFSLGQREYSAGATPPANNIDTTKLADDDPRTASLYDDYLSIPSWNDWPKKLSYVLKYDLTARQYRPESRDFISMRFFKRENDQFDPMVYLSHHENCFEESNTTSPGILNMPKESIRPKLTKIKCVSILEENTIRTTQWGVTGNRQGWRRLSVARPMVIYYDVTSHAKEFWRLAKRLSYWNCVDESIHFSTKCTRQVLKHTCKTRSIYMNIAHSVEENQKHISEGSNRQNPKYIHGDLSFSQSKLEAHNNTK